MRRRRFFEALLAVASAFVVAPKMEMASVAIAEARAEGYERGRAIEQAKAESRLHLT